MGDQTCGKCGKEGVDGRHTSKCKGAKDDKPKRARRMKARASAAAPAANGDLAGKGFLEELLKARRAEVARVDGEIKRLQELRGKLETQAAELEGGK